MGNHAVSCGVQLARAEVIAAYPDHAADPDRRGAVRDVRGRAAEPRGSSRSSPSTRRWPPASAPPRPGARAFTATSSQGLALMHEMLHWAARRAAADRDGRRQPRDGAGLDDLDRPERHPVAARHRLDPALLRDQPGSARHHDPGVQLAEAVDLPVMIVLDAFFLSHTSEPVDIPDAGRRGRVPAAARGRAAARHERPARLRRADAARRLHGDAAAPAGGDGRGACTRSTPWTTDWGRALRPPLRRDRVATGPRVPSSCS